MLVLIALLASCNDAGFTAVSISPIYGWTDGCKPVTITGRGFDASASATVGGKDVTAVTYPSAPKNPLTPSSVGYELSGTVPAGSAGYAEVSVKSGGATSTLTGTAGYYYVACPGAGTIDAVSTPDPLVGGGLVTVDGCGLDAATITARIVAADDSTVADAIPLASLCGTASVTFEAPDLPEGSYFLQLVDTGTGGVLTGAICPPADSADTGSGCTDFPIAYGAAQ